MSQVYTISKPVNIVEVLPADKILLTPISKEITALIEGRGWDLLFEFLFKKEFHLQQFPDSENSLTISNEEIKRKIENEFNANDLTVLSIILDSKVISIEDKVTKKVPLYLNNNITLEKGHQLADTVNFSPPYVVITGPVSLVQEIEKWPIHYESDIPLKATKSQRISIKKPEPPLKSDIQEVDMTIPVEAFTEKSIFVPVDVNNLSNQKILIFPEKIQVSVLVGLSRFNQTSPEDFKLTVTFNEEQNENIQFLQVEIKSKPDWVSHLKLSSQTVRYFVIK